MLRVGGSGVVQLSERLLLIPEDLGSNPVNGNFYWTFIYCWLFVERTKIKKNRPGMAHFKKKYATLK